MALMVPKIGSEGLKNRPGLMKIFGKYTPKNGCYSCIFIHYCLAFCINIQSRVKVFRNSCHDHNGDRIRGADLYGREPQPPWPTRPFAVYPSPGLHYLYGLAMTVGGASETKTNGFGRFYYQQNRVFRPACTTFMASP